MDKENIEVEKLNTRLINDKKVKKEKNNFNEYRQNNIPFIIFLLIILLIFISYILISTSLISIGAISIYQNLSNTNELINGFDNIVWGIVFLIIGIIMILPIVRYFRTLFFIIKSDYLYKKENKK